MFDSIINRGEYYSNHYLDVLMPNDLAGLRASWEHAERRGEPTARSHLRGLSRPYFATKTRATQHTDPDQLRALHDLILSALGFSPARTDLIITRANTEISVPVAATVATHTGLLLVALDAGLAVDVDEVLDTDPHGPGALLVPIGADRPAKERIAAATDAASLLFACDDPPRYVLIVAGGLVVLADRTAWGEGRFLAVDLDLALSRGDTKAKGELETIAALISADSLVPTEGPSVADNLSAASQKHAVGVSKDLRDGIRLSVELLANEVIAQRLASNQAVYSEPELAKQLTRQCLRFLYRLLFLLYAESRPELGIVPKDHPEYDEGYGLDRLRDLALTPLTNDRSRDGSHLHESLKLLFRLVNDGHGHAQAAQSLLATSEGIGLRFEPLRSELFDPKATGLLDRVKLRNQVLQQVLRLLMLSQETKGKARGFVSYANLGINQLGAVYEGLMAYTGFFAADDLYEVSMPGAADKGTWVVRVRDAGDLPDEVFVTRPHLETGVPTRVLHPKGSFVFRLSGRDRQRSASYYTPEILTRCVVRHALAELFDQNDSTSPAAEILELTICEPALGSGAFLNEAINELAGEYLHRRQAELGQTIDPDQYATELQKVKAHLALHQCYGVDLNATAVELAEVSLWLNCTYPGLQAPWFGMHLRRGNSLIGARRATYPRTKLAKAAWLTEVPTDRKLVEGPIGADAIHHFLLPSQGWAAVADAKQAKELRPEATARLKAWRTSIRRPPSDKDGKRLLGLAQRVEALWTQATQRLRLAEGDLRRSIDIWGTEANPDAPVYRSREAIEELLRDRGSPLGRLRLVMDAWCALWFWPVAEPEGMPSPPTAGQWLDALEGVLGIQPVETPLGQLALFDPADLDALVERDRQLQFEFRMRSVDDVVADHPWLNVVREIADREGFWHWELEFAPIFEKGGFDLQVGNPPWVLIDWDETATLAELDPWFALIENRASAVTRRANLLSSSTALGAYMGELSAQRGVAAFYGSETLYPDTSSGSPNVYRKFIESTTKRAPRNGCVGLLHPDSHLVDKDTTHLREFCYTRLRRHWHFVNQLHLFEEIGNTRTFAVSIYGTSVPEPHFLMASHLFHPSTIEDSFQHDGSGEPPGIKTNNDAWDLTPHRSRIISIDITTLQVWASLFGQSSPREYSAPMVNLLTQFEAKTLLRLSRVPLRLRDIAFAYQGGLDEARLLRLKLAVTHPLRPKELSRCLFQAPYFGPSTLFSQESREPHKSHRDYRSIDLRELDGDWLPEMRYRLAKDASDLREQLEAESALEVWSTYRVLYKRWCDPQGERTLQACLLPPEAEFSGAAAAIRCRTNVNAVTLTGFWSSLPVDYLVKVLGKQNLYADVVRDLPLSIDSPLQSALLLRTMRLNCLTSSYASLWEELYDDRWKTESWATPQDCRTSGLEISTPHWTRAVPLRTAFERRAALVELDALVALMLGLSSAELCAIYRAQFPVLRKYENAAVFDNNGRKLPTDLARQWRATGESLADSGFDAPYVVSDREDAMSIAYDEFERRLTAPRISAQSRDYS
jgi:hypothetical protein